MSGVMWLVVAGGVLVLPVVVASLWICAPKWWERRAPGFVRAPVERTGEWLMADVGGYRIARPLARAGEAVLVTVAIPVFFVVFTVFLYVRACGAVIERACPYTESDSLARSVRNDWEEWKKAAFMPVGELWRRVCE